MSICTSIVCLSLSVLCLALFIEVIHLSGITLDVAGDIPEPFECPPLDESAALDRFRGLIRFESVSNGSKADHVNDAKCFRDMIAYLELSYPLVWERLKVEQVGENGLSILITWPGTNPHLRPVLFVSHYDVVPVTRGSEHEWTHPPFSGELADGFVWGRGSLDIKFGVSGLLQAVSTLLAGQGGKEGEFRPDRTILIAIGHDEEVGGGHGAGVTAALLRSRGIELDVVVDEGGAVVVRGPWSPVLSKPVAMVGTAEKGSAWIEVKLHLYGGHSAMAAPPTAGAGDAAKQISRFRNLLQPLPSRGGGGLPPPTGAMVTHLLPYMPKWIAWPMAAIGRSMYLNAPDTVLKGLQSHGLHVLSSMMATTFAITRIQAGVANNVLPQTAVLVVNARLLPQHTPAQVVEHLQGLVGREGLNAEVRLMKEEPPWPGSYLTPAEGRHYKRLRRAIQETWQLEDQLLPAVVPYLLAGATDSRHFAPLSRGGVLRFTPYAINMSAGELGTIHGTNERVRASSFLRGVCTYIRAMQHLAGPEGTNVRKDQEAEAEVEVEVKRLLVRSREEEVKAAAAMRREVAEEDLVLLMQGTEEHQEMVVLANVSSTFPE